MKLNSLQHYFLILLCLVWVQFSEAKKFKYTIQPLVGFESVYRANPHPGTIIQIFYGGRLTGGLDIFSIETEYTQSSTQETFETAPEKMTTQDQKLKLGGLSLIDLTESFNLSLRAGGQAKKSLVESISAGVKTTEEKDIEYDPYLGLGLGLKLGKMIINLSTTVVINDYSNLKKDEIQNNLSIVFGI